MVNNDNRRREQNTKVMKITNLKQKIAGAKTESLPPTGRLVGQVLKPTRER